MSTQTKWNKDLAFQYLHRHWQQEGEFQEKIGSLKEFQREGTLTKIYPKHLFANLFIYEQLDQLGLNAEIKKSIEEKIKKSMGPCGLIAHFYEKRIWPPDLDNTPLGISILLRGGKIDSSFAKKVAVQILANTKNGIIKAFFHEENEIIDAVFCANALFFIYSYNLSASKTEDYLLDILFSNTYEGHSCYPSIDAFYCKIASLVAVFPLRASRFEGPLQSKLQERIGATCSPLELAWRILSAKHFRINNQVDAKKLMTLQREDGSWDLDILTQVKAKIIAHSDLKSIPWICEAAKQDDCICFGSKEITTALAIHALDNYH